jgi:glutamyl/glutaminyl-tRNA synthetase
MLDQIIKTSNIPPDHEQLIGRDFREYTRAILRADPKSYVPVEGFWERHRSFYYIEEEDIEIMNKPLSNQQLAYDTFLELKEITDTEWKRENLSKNFHKVISKNLQQSQSIEQDPSVAEKHATRNLMADLRQLVMACRRGPGMSITMEILGKAESLKRLARVQDLSTQHSLPDEQTQQATSTA